MQDQAGSVPDQRNRRLRARATTSATPALRSGCALGEVAHPRQHGEQIHGRIRLAIIANRQLPKAPKQLPGLRDRQPLERVRTLTPVICAKEKHHGRTAFGIELAGADHGE
jgi:hypothetical protein